MRKHILTLNLILCVLCIFASEVLSQGVIELKPPTTDTIDGTIQQLDKVKKFMIIKPDGKELKIFWNDKTQVVLLQERSATIDDLKVGQEVRIKYTSEKRVLIIRNIPTEVVMGDLIASEVKIIFGHSNQVYREKEKEYKLACEKENMPNCKEECCKMFKKAQLKEGITIDECFKALCK